MSIIKDISINHYKDYDNSNWSDSRIENSIFNDLMREEIFNKYALLIEEKFEDLRRGSTYTFIEISYKDLSDNTKFYIEEYVKDCTTQEEQYLRLNAIMPDVIAQLTNQVRHRILAKRMKDPVITNVALNSMRELASNHWRFIN